MSSVPWWKRTLVRVLGLCLLLGFLGFGGWLIAVYCLAEYHLRRAHQAISAQHLGKAWEELQRAKTFRPRSPAIRLLLARVARQRYLYQEAHDQLSRYQELGGPDTEEVQLERLMLRAQTGEVTTVFPYLWRYAEEEKPQAPLALEALVVGCLLVNRSTEAQICLRRWKELDPDNIQRLLYAGWAEELRDNTIAARDHYRRALELDPERTDIRLRLVNVLLMRQEDREAITECEALLRHDLGNLAARIGLARAQHNLGLLDKARENLQLILRDDPENLEALKDLAWVTLDEGKNEEAESLLRKVLNKAPANHSALYNLVICLRKLGRTSEAQTYVQQLARIEKDNTRLHSVVLRGLAEHPDDLELAYEAAKIYLRLGDESEALTWFGRVLKGNPNHQGAHQRLADYYDKKGDAKRAAAHRARLQQR